MAKILTEAVDYSVTKEGKRHYITGPFIQCNVPNRNGRLYPLENIQPEVDRYIKEMVKTNRAIGELGHPKDTELNYERACIKIVGLTLSGSDYIGKALVLSTPHGKLISNLLDDEVQLAVSSRGMGSLVKDSRGVNVVQSDYELATVADVVSDPSAPNAFVRGIMENASWTTEKGILTEQELDKFKKSFAKSFNVNKATVAFEAFINKISNPESSIAMDKLEEFFETM